MHKLAIPDFAVERGKLMRSELVVNPATTAVIAIDFQQFFIDEGQPLGNQHARDILVNANRVHAAVREAGGLVIFTQHSFAEPGYAAVAISERMELVPGSPSYDLHPEIKVLDGDIQIVKHQSSPLHPSAKTDLHKLLQERGTTTLIITGLVTNGCCDCTARDAFQYGYEVVVINDATAALSDEEHNGALMSLGIYYAHVLDTDKLIQHLTT